MAISGIIVMIHSFLGKKHEALQKQYLVYYNCISVSEKKALLFHLFSLVETGRRSMRRLKKTKNKNTKMMRPAKTPKHS